MRLVADRHATFQQVLWRRRPLVTSLEGETTSRCDSQAPEWNYQLMDLAHLGNALFEGDRKEPASEYLISYHRSQSVWSVNFFRRTKPDRNLITHHSEHLARGMKTWKIKGKVITKLISFWAKYEYITRSHPRATASDESNNLPNRLHYKWEIVT